MALSGVWYQGAKIFLIDPSTVPYIKQGVQRKVIKFDEVFKLTRTWCHAIEKEVTNNWKIQKDLILVLLKYYAGLNLYRL